MSYVDLVLLVTKPSPRWKFPILDGPGVTIGATASIVGPFGAGVLGIMAGALSGTQLANWASWKALDWRKPTVIIFYTYVYHLIHGDDDDNNSV